MTDNYLKYKEEILRMRRKWHRLNEDERNDYKAVVYQFLSGKSKEEQTVIADILTECVNEDIHTLENVATLISSSARAGTR